MVTCLCNIHSRRELYERETISHSYHGYAYVHWVGTALATDYAIRGKTADDPILVKDVVGQVIADGSNTTPGVNAEAWGPYSKIKAGKLNAKATLGGSALEGDAMAIGHQSVAQGGGSLAVGNTAKANGGLSIAIGKDAEIINKNTGDYRVSGGAAVAIGNGAKAWGNSSVALGQSSEASEEKTVSVGKVGMYRRIVNVEAGKNPNDVVIYKQVFGTVEPDGDNKNPYEQAEAWGPNSKIKAGKWNAKAALGGKAMERATTAIGYNTTANGFRSLALGNTTTANGENSIAIGHSTNTANVWGAIAIGFEANSNKANAVALGTRSVADEDNTISVGDKAKNYNRRIVNVADGSVAENSKEVVNGGQLWKVDKATKDLQKDITESLKKYVPRGTEAGDAALAIGSNANANGLAATAINGGTATGTYTFSAGLSSKAQQPFAVAIGVLSEAGLSDKGYEDPIWKNLHYSSTDPTGKERAVTGAVAIGYDAKALGYRNIAIGENSRTAKSEYDDNYVPIKKNAGTNFPVYDKAGVIGSIAIGGYAITEGSHSTVIGNAAYALGNHTSAYGIRSYAVGSRSSAFGNSATVMEADGVALGSMARVNEGDKNSVALGNNSITEKAQSTKSYTIPTNNAEYIKQIKDGKTITFAGSEASATVSIGGLGVDKYLGDKNDKGDLIGYTDPYDNLVMRKKAMYRTVTNVAAGRISETSTDAINGSQLYYVLGQTQINAENIAKAGQNLDGLKEQVDKNTAGLKEQDEKITKIEAKDKEQDTRLDELEKQQGSIGDSIKDINKGLDDFKKGTDKQFKDVNKRVDEVKKTADQNKKDIDIIKDSQKGQGLKLTEITKTVNDHETRITNNEKVIKEHTETIKENQEKIANNSERISENRRDIDLNRQDIDALAQA